MIFRQTLDLTLGLTLVLGLALGLTLELLLITGKKPVKITHIITHYESLVSLILITNIW